MTTQSLRATDIDFLTVLQSHGHQLFCLERMVHFSPACSSLILRYLHVAWVRMWGACIIMFGLRCDSSPATCVLVASTAVWAVQSHFQFTVRVSFTNIMPQLCVAIRRGCGSHHLVARYMYLHPHRYTSRGRSGWR